MVKYKIEVDRNKCIGCGACVALCGEVFELKGGKAAAKKKESDKDCVKDAADNCPVQAIKLKKVWTVTLKLQKRKIYIVYQK